MAAQGKGVIVNTSSGSGFGHPSHCVYSAAKEGVIGLTRTSALQLGRFGIRTNAIRPVVRCSPRSTATWRAIRN